MMTFSAVDRELQAKTLALWSDGKNMQWQLSKGLSGNPKETGSLKYKY